VSILEILWAIFVIAAVFLALCTSIGMLVINKERYEELCDRWPILELIPEVGGFIIFFTVLMIGGQIGRGEIPGWPPWDTVISDARLHGFWDATFKSLEVTTFHLWAFVIPGHLSANDIAKRKGRRPWTPYVINILVGLLLCSPCNPIYRMFSP
jgi:ABC-type glycerol-3-phosphate transport system permease component